MKNAFENNLERSGTGLFEGTRSEFAWKDRKKAKQI
jgi:hypothetical protein